jgi:hypothetical protein
MISVGEMQITVGPEKISGRYRRIAAEEQIIPDGKQDIFNPGHRVFAGEHICSDCKHIFYSHEQQFPARVPFPLRPYGALRPPP